MLNKIFPLLLFFFAELYSACIGCEENLCDSYYVVHSILSMDDKLAFNLSKADSLAQIMTEEARKFQHREICLNQHCIFNGCGRFIRFPKNLHSKLPQDKWIELWGYANDNNGIYLLPADTLYEERCRQLGAVTVTDPPLALTDSCSLRFSSEISPSGEQIILINGTAYRIAKRKDGSNVLRKEK